MGRTGGQLSKEEVGHRFALGFHFTKRRGLQIHFEFRPSSFNRASTHKARILRSGHDYGVNFLNKRHARRHEIGYNRNLVGVSPLRWN